ncbi:SCO family protein [Flavobacterium ardleyense]|uniref:SCO family protein n=1 Tax=Flavobacterium ardleyense TaxID=2038737 RepID=UPI00298BCE10|nr:SCO family protein [Flavobacterium ardleyense]
MWEIFKKYKIYFGTMLIVSIVTLTLFFNALTPQKSLPIYNPSMVNPELVDTTIQYIARNHTIGDFSFLNQNGEKITQADYDNKVYVADFFFTTCPTICIAMTDNMVRIQEALKDDKNVKLLSFSVTPEIDSVPVLKAYALEKGVIDSKWNLLTGDKKEIYTLARKSYLVVKEGKPEELYDMVHTENFVLVDRKKRVRGFYDGTKTEDVDRLIEDIKWLSTRKKN